MLLSAGVQGGGICTARSCAATSSAFAQRGAALAAVRPRRRLAQSGMDRRVLRSAATGSSSSTTTRPLLPLFDLSDGSTHADARGGGAVAPKANARGIGSRAAAPPRVPLGTASWRALHHPAHCTRPVRSVVRRWHRHRLLAPRSVHSRLVGGCGGQVVCLTRLAAAAIDPPAALDTPELLERRAPRPTGGA